MQPLRDATGRPSRLTLEVDDDCVVLVIEAVLDQSVPHPTGLDGHDEIRVVIQKLDGIRIVRDLIPAFPDVLLAVDFAVTATGLFAKEERTHERRPGLLRAHVEVLPLDAGDDLEVLDQVVRLALVVELGFLLVPGLAEIIELPECRGAVLVELVCEKLDSVNRLEEFSSPANRVGTPGTRPVAIDPDPGVLVEDDVRLRPGRDLHVGDLAHFELIVELCRQVDQLCSGF